MSKTADLHQEYQDYLEANKPYADLEHGPDPDDVEFGQELMSFQEFCEYLDSMEQIHADDGPYGRIV